MGVGADVEVGVVGAETMKVTVVEVAVSAVRTAMGPASNVAPTVSKNDVTATTIELCLPPLTILHFAAPLTSGPNVL